MVTHHTLSGDYEIYPSDTTINYLSPSYTPSAGPSLLIPLNSSLPLPLSPSVYMHLLLYVSSLILGES
jgi:hypothetical protein